ncbi:hypothetical protein V8C86DRAFT_2529849 [Haematococcus lacustris]
MHRDGPITEHIVCELGRCTMWGESAACGSCRPGLLCSRCAHLLPGPPAWQPGPGIPRTVVYLYGDPWPCIASHYRRGQAHHQALKTNENPARVGRLEDFPCSLEQYCDRGEDLLGLNAHFHNWLQGSPHYPITMVRYESLWDPAVALELLRRCCSHKADMHQVQIWTQEWCQARRQRTSQVPPCCHESPLYQELQRVIDEMPPLHG